MTKDEYSEEDFRYMRTGFIPTGKLVDELVAKLFKEFPGGTLPLYWRYHSNEVFLRRYGPINPIMWAKSASSVTMLYNGQYVLRLWAKYPDTPTMDMSNALAGQMQQHIPVEDIPKGLLAKCKPLTRRGHILSTVELDLVISNVKTIYGI